jgi:hypothetical protein
MSNRTKSSPKPQTFALDDTLERTIVDPTTNKEDYPRAFIPDVDGVLGVVALDDTPQTIPVKGGAIYAITVKKYTIIGTSGVTSVTGLA